MGASQLEYKLCQKAFSKVNNLLKIVGICLDINKRDFKFKDLCRKWVFCVNFLSLIMVILGETLWLVQSSITGTLSLLKLTYCGPCLAICVLGCVKSFFFVKNSVRIARLVRSFYTLFSKISNLGPDDKLKTELYMQSQLNFLSTSINMLTMLNCLGVTAFTVGPIVIMISQYYATKNFEFLLPFFIVYPFNPFSLRWWPIVYIHQIWSATLAVFTVLGPDSLLHTSCVLLNVKFFQLKREIEMVFDSKYNVANIPVRYKLAGIINEHKKLLSSMDLIESIYSGSTLCNVLTSSILICFTGFNVMAYDNMLIIIPFICFLIMVVGQIFLLCYYGDLLQKSSGELSIAAYNSNWYQEKTTVLKDLMIISARAQKPCKLTAFGYADMNIEVFSKIMSTAWSYFAVLLSFHNRG